VGSRNKARGDEAAAKLKSEGGEVGHLDLEIDLGDSATIASAAQSINTDFFLSSVAATWVHDGSRVIRVRSIHLRRSRMEP
jgi:hypothetical protein